MHLSMSETPKVKVLMSNKAVFFLVHFIHLNQELMLKFPHSPPLSLRKDNMHLFLKGKFAFPNLDQSSHEYVEVLSLAISEVEVNS